MNKITLIKKENQVPEKLVDGCIIMNGSGKDLTLTKVVPSIDINPRTLDVTENGEYTVKASDKGFDAMKTVNVNVNVKSESYFTRFDNIQQVSAQYSYDESEEEIVRHIKPALSQLKDFAEHCDCIGALLSVNSEDLGDGEKFTYTIWNGNPDNPDYYWDPESEDSKMPDDYFGYGTAVAVCMGKGMWVMSRESMYTGNWADQGTDLFNNYIGYTVNKTGWESTKHIFENYASSIYGRNTIWSQITSNNLGTLWYGIPAWSIFDEGLSWYGNIYIPSSTELWETRNRCVHAWDDSSTNFTFNSNLSYFVGFDDAVNKQIWSCSQYVYNPDYAYYLSYADFLDYYNKSTESTCVVCLRFGDTSASE